MDVNRKLLIVLVKVLIIIALATPIYACERVPKAGNTSVLEKAEANWWIPLGILGGLILLMIVFSISASLYDVVCSSCKWRGKYLRWKMHGSCPRCNSYRFYEEQGT